MSYTLGIDTSFEVSVGLASDGEPLDTITVHDTRAHAEALVPAIVELCERAGIGLADLDAIAVGMGPGPFTGLRVGIVTAWTLASLGGLVPRGVCSLDVIARQSVRRGGPGDVVVASDARRKELYWARYVDGVRTDGPHVSATVPDGEVVGPLQDSPTLLDASVLAADWHLMAPVAEPMYLRGADATVSTRTKSALPRVKRR